MNELPKYKVYRTGQIYRLGIIYAVIAYSKVENDANFNVEWYYFIKNQK
jgi:hypothetical protein